MSSEASHQEPKTSRWGTVTLFATVVCAGILAGFFLTYAHTIMPALGVIDDLTFVTVYQQIEWAVSGGAEGPGGFNVTVAITFFGLAALIVLAIVLNRRRPLVWWIVAALGLHLVTMVSTIVFNVPLNNEIVAAGDPSLIDVAQVRIDFREGWWQMWNLIRSATSTAATGCLAWALFLKGRAAYR